MNGNRWITNEILTSGLKPDIIDNVNKNVWELKPSTWNPFSAGGRSYPNYKKAKAQLENYVEKMNNGETALGGTFSKGGTVFESPVPQGPLLLRLPSADGQYMFTYYVTNTATGIVYYEYSKIPRGKDKPGIPIANAKPDEKSDDNGVKEPGKVIPMPVQKVEVDPEEVGKVAATAITAYVVFRIIRFVITIECGGCGAWAF